MLRARTCLLFVLVAIVTAREPGSAQQAPPQTPPSPQTDPPTFRSSINFVEVDVIVTGDDRQVVTDLREEDFEVTEDGKLQEIQEFRFVRLGAPPSDAPAPKPIRSAYDEETEAARDDVRLFGIFFDDDALGQAGGATGSFKGKEDVERVRTPLIRFVQSLRPTDMVATMYATTPLSAVTFTRDRDETIREINRFADGLFDRRDRDERLRLNNPYVPIDRRRNIRGLEALSAKMATLRDGRKSIVYVGRGPANAFSSSFVGGRLDFDELTTTLNRSNTSVYVLDPGGLRVAGGGTALASLRELAESTGGLAIVDTNAMDEGLKRVADDASAYYVLGYTSPASADGQFHEIKIRVKRRGVDVRGRSGYWAYSAEALKRAAAPPRWTTSPVMDALGSLATTGGTAQGAGRTWLGTSRHEDGSPRVTIAWEASTRASAAPQPRIAAVAVTATDAAGVEVFTDRHALATGGAARLGPSASGRNAFGTVPGRLQVRVSFEDASGEVIDSDVRSIMVPDFAGSAPAFSTPRVFRAANAREFSAAASNADAVPSASREFARTDRLLVRFDSYRPDGEPQAAVLNRQGDRMFDLPVSRATAGATHQIDLMLNRVPAGEYVIELRSPDPGQRELIAVRVR